MRKAFNNKWQKQRAGATNVRYPMAEYKQAVYLSPYW